MLVKKWMSSDPITIDEETSVMKATQIMKENGIRRLPVMRGGKLVGLVSDRDLKEASPSKATTLDVHELYYLLSELKVKDIMSRDVVTVQSSDTVEMAAVKMLEHKISGLPVMDEDDQLVGILTMTDVFKALISITGIYRGGIQFGFSLPDRPGVLGEVASVIRKHGGRLVSILSATEASQQGTRDVFIRIADMPADKLALLTKELESNFVLHYVHKDQLEKV